MPSYKEFAQKARERFEKRRQSMALGKGGYQFTAHVQYKMKQYGLSEQKVRSVIHSPKRTEEAIVPKMIAVMQPVSVKRDTKGKEMWKQEIWVMFKRQGTMNNKQQTKSKESEYRSLLTVPCSLKIISTWRYPGMSPKRNPIPEEILLELERDDISEVE